MADNVAITAGSGTTIRTKDRSAVETQLVALDLNPNGAEQLMAGVMPSGGDVAHDGVDSGNPIKVGSRSVAFGANPTEVAAADRSDALSNRHSIIWVQPGHPNIIVKRERITAAKTDYALLTPTSGKKAIVLSVTVATANGNNADPSVLIGLHATTTPTSGAVLFSHPGMPPGQMFREDAGGAPLCGTPAANDKVLLTCDDPSGNMDTTIRYYEVTS